jgi:hypothetical protein
MENKIIFDMLYNAYSKYYSPSEHLAVGEVTVIFRGGGHFWITHTQETQRFGIKMFKLCDMSGYT